MIYKSLAITIGTIVSGGVLIKTINQNSINEVLKMEDYLEEERDEE